MRTLKIVANVTAKVAKKHLQAAISSLPGEVMLSVA